MMSNVTRFPAMRDEIAELRTLIGQMGGRAELAIAEAMTALARGDEAGAARVVSEDLAIDRLQAELETRATERERLLRAAAGDDDAMRLVYREHVDAVFRTACRVLGAQGLGLDDGAGAVLRAEVGARQEDLADADRAGTQALTELRDRHDVVLLAMGVYQPRILSAPGRGPARAWATAAPPPSCWPVWASAW